MCARSTAPSPPATAAELRSTGDNAALQESGGLKEALGAADVAVRHRKCLGGRGGRSTLLDGGRVRSCSNTRNSCPSTGPANPALQSDLTSSCIMWNLCRVLHPPARPSPPPPPRLGNGWQIRSLRNALCRFHRYSLTLTPGRPARLSGGQARGPSALKAQRAARSSNFPPEPRPRAGVCGLTWGLGVRCGGWGRLRLQHK